MESSIDSAKAIVQSLKETSMYHKDGLLESFHTIDQTSDWPPIYSADNALFGILLHAVGEQAEAERIAFEIEHGKNRLCRKGLVSKSIKRNGSFGESVETVFDNSLWGMLLHRLGRTSEARRIAEKIQPMPDSDYIIEISNPSQIYGCFARLVGMDDVAAEVAETVSPKLSFVYHNRMTSAIFHTVNTKYEPALGVSIKSGSIDSLTNTQHSLLLSALGYDVRAVQMVEHMRNVPYLLRPDGLIHRYLQVEKGVFRKPEPTHYDGEIFTADNCWWGLAQQAACMSERADDLIATMKSFPNLSAGDALLRESAGGDGTEGQHKGTHAYDNLLWGLLNLRIGYKVFTGK